MTKFQFSNAVLAALTTMVASFAGSAQPQSQKDKILVVKPHDLPQVAQLSGNSFFLHATTNGGYYLYVEQQNGSQLTIFDVSDPEHIKVKSTEQLSAAGPYDFIRPLGESSELVRFRNGKDVAVLDLSKDDHPSLRDAAALKDSPKTVVLDKSDSTDTAATYTDVRSVPKDYKVVDDTTSPGKPQLIATIKNVEHQLTNDSTGTTFLLGQNGLTVIRRTDVEQQYKIHQMQTSSQ
jgi:hypothetical protein